MKKRCKVLLIIIFTFFIMLLTNGCGNGANIRTDLTFEENLSGRRMMETSISKSVFNQYFTGTLDDLKGLLREKCPSELTWSVEEKGDDYVCTFILVFDSMDTYKTKVTSLLGQDGEVEVVQADTVFAKGIAYEEGFSSKELLSWFSTALIEAGYVNSDNESEIFHSDTTSFIFATKEYETSNYVSVSDLIYLDNGIIDILTTPHYDDTYDRTILFHIPTSTLEQNQEKIITFMEEGVPSSATSSWKEDSGKKESVFQIDMERATIEELDLAMKSIFHSDNAKVSSISYAGDLSILDCGLGFKETLDLSQFISNRNATASVGYYVSSKLIETASQIHEDDSLSEIHAYESEEYPDYNTILKNDISQISLQIDSIFSYIPDSIHVLTQVKSEDKIDRNIEFIYTKEFEAEEKTNLKEHISNFTAGHADVSYQMQEDNYVITFHQSGTEAEITSGFHSIFGETNSRLHYTRESSKIAFTVDSFFEESISFYELLGESGKNIPLTYTARLTEGEKIDKDSFINQTSASRESIDGNSITIVSETPSIDFVLSALKFNSLALFWWTFILVLALVFITAGYIVYLKIKESASEKTKSNLDAKKIFNNIKNKFMGILQKKKCLSCNSIIDKKVKYCTQCGVKLDGIVARKALKADESIDSNESGEE